MTIRKCAALLLAVLLLIPAVCAAERADFSRRGSISVTLRETDTKEPVPGGEMTAYFVAALAQEDGNEVLVYTGDFADCGIPAAELLDRLPAETLAQYAAEHSVPGESSPIGEDGTARFSDLTLGLYLIVQTAPAPGREAVNPFLVTVPQRVNGEVIYDVDATPKPGTVAPSSPTPTPSPSGPGLPQTGQLWWPVPVLAVLGLLLIALGWRRKA